LVLIFDDVNFVEHHSCHVRERRRAAISLKLVCKIQRLYIAYILQKKSARLTMKILRYLSWHVETSSVSDFLSASVFTYCAKYYEIERVLVTGILIWSDQKYVPEIQMAVYTHKLTDHFSPNLW